MIPFKIPSRYKTQRFCGRTCASATTGENTTNIRPRRPTLVEIRYCALCGWIIPRNGKRPSAYQRKQFCSDTCWKKNLADIYTKPDSTDYSTVHHRVYRARGPAASYDCEHCGGPALDWAWLHGKDGMSPDDFMPLCRKCHVAYDGNGDKSVATRRANGTLHHTEEQRAARSEFFKAMRAKMSTEERSDMMRRAWVTRRARMSEGEANG